jgi:hypothetical protein
MHERGDPTDAAVGCKGEHFSARHQWGDPHRWRQN